MSSSTYPSDPLPTQSSNYKPLSNSKLKDIKNSDLSKYEMSWWFNKDRSRTLTINQLMVFTTIGFLIAAKYNKNYYSRVIPYMNTKLYDNVVKKLTLLPFEKKFPNVNNNTFIAFNSSVIGDVKIGEKSSVWYKAVLRGDVNNIEIGNNVHIQDGCIVHVAKNGLKAVPISTIVGDNVVVGPNSLLHACTLKGNNVVGPNSQVLDGAVMELNTILEAGSIVLPGKVVPSGQIWGGVPAKCVRVLTDAEISEIHKTVQIEGELAVLHKSEEVCIEEMIHTYLYRKGKEEYNPEHVRTVSGVSPYDKRPSTQNVI